MGLFKPLKIKVRRICKDNPLPEVNPKGDWIDLRTAETVQFEPPTVKKVRTDDGKFTSTVVFDIKTIHLGVAMKLPDGCEAYLLNRSGTGKGMGITLINGEGIIDGSFSGNDDEWRFPAIAFKKCTLKGPHDEPTLDAEGNPIKDDKGEVIPKFVGGERFCQFRIMPSQKATWKQKLRWLFAKGVEIEEVDTLDSVNRGGGCIRVEESK